MLRICRNISICTLLCAVLGAGFFFVLMGVVSESVYHQEALVVEGGMLSSISADAIYVFDLQTGTEIFSRDKHTVRSVASITKLLSATMFLEHASTTAMATVLLEDVETEGRSGRLEATEQYKNKDLLFPALLESSNDASVVMQRVSPVDIVEQMNQYAASHGLEQTAFTDTSGLDDGNVSTAYELGKLSAMLFTEYPHIYDITRLKTYLNHINAWMNNSPFVYDAGYRGGKHGYTYAANRTVTAFFDEQLATGQTRTVGYVLLGSDGLQTDMQHLRAYVQRAVTYQ